MKPEKLIKTYQELRGWSDEELCELLGVNDLALTSWRIGAEMPRAAAILLVLLGEEIVTSEDLSLAVEVVQS